MSAASGSSRNPQDRPPRFVLKEHENQALAFSRGGSHPMCLAQKVMDFSAGGVAFTVQFHERPEVSEVLQIEMKILNNVHTVNRKGRVLRVETLQAEDGTPYVRVGVQFIDEPTATATLVAAKPQSSEGWKAPLAYAVIGLIALGMVALFFFV
jgi:hypothetical protein